MMGQICLSFKFIRFGQLKWHDWEGVETHYIRSWKSPINLFSPEMVSFAVHRERDREWKKDMKMER